MTRQTGSGITSSIAQTAHKGKTSSRPQLVHPVDFTNDKSADEIELEKLVFGDDAGFQNALKLRPYNGKGSIEIDVSETENFDGSNVDGEDDLEALPDDDVCSLSIYTSRMPDITAFLHRHWRHLK